MLSDDCEDGPPEVTFNDVRRGKYIHNIIYQFDRITFVEIIEFNICGIIFTHISHAPSTYTNIITNSIW